MLVGNPQTPSLLSLEEVSLQELRSSLENLTVSTMRQIARRWGWPLRGVAKLDIVNQLSARLTDPEQMRAIVEGLPPDAREVLACWTATAQPDLRALQTSLQSGSGLKFTQNALRKVLAELAVGGLILPTIFSEDDYEVPSAYYTWLPALRAEKLRFKGTPTTKVMPYIDLLQRVDLILTGLEDGGVAATYPRVSLVPFPGRRMVSIAPVEAILPTATWEQWGFDMPEEEHLARFLLELLGGTNLIQLTGKDKPRLEVTSNKTTWYQADPVARMAVLRQIYFGMADDSEGFWGSWSELDLALPTITGFRLNSVYGRLNLQSINTLIFELRSQLQLLLHRLERDTWYDVDRLLGLCYHLMRSPFVSSDLLSDGVILHWSEQDLPLDPLHMSLDTWRATFGKLFQVVLSGPLFWLQEVELGFLDDKWVAVRIPSQPTAGIAEPPQSGLMTFVDDEHILLLNTRSTGELRSLVRLISEPVAQRAKGSMYRLSSAVWLATLQKNITLPVVIERFATSGYPLPAAIIEQLQHWQATAGRHHLYDNISVIELSSDALAVEIEAIINRERIPFYRASSRCFLLLDADAAQRLTAELTRRGYTPKVITA